MNLVKNNELVSIIIVNWNGKKWIKKCLVTLSNQIYNNTEIIVVDNASEDDSIGYIRSNFSKVKIIENKTNLGFSRATNIGIKASKGYYLLLINEDTWVSNGFLLNLINFYKSNNYSVIAPLEKDYNKKSTPKFNPTIDLTGSYYCISPFNKNKLFYLNGACLFFKKNIYFKTQGLDNNYFMYFEDVDWFWRLSLLGKKFSYVEYIYIFHAGAGSTGKGIKYKMFLYRNQNSLQTILKNYSLTFLIFILPIYFIQNIFEIVFFVIILKPKIAFSYLEGWWFNFKNLPKILEKRKWIQKRRVVSDLEIVRKMYLGTAKLKMLMNYI